MLNHIAISKAIYKVLLFFVKAALCDSEFYNIRTIISTLISIVRIQMHTGSSLQYT